MAMPDPAGFSRGRYQAPVSNNNNNNSQSQYSAPRTGTFGPNGGPPPPPPPPRTTGASTTAPSEPGVYERRLVDEICAPGGARVAIESKTLEAFCRSCESLDCQVISQLLAEKLTSGNWQVKVKILCILEALLDQSMDGITGDVSERARDVLLGTLEIPQCKPKALKVVPRLGLISLDRLPQTGPRSSTGVRGESSLDSVDLLGDGTAEPVHVKPQTNSVASDAGVDLLGTSPTLRAKPELPQLIQSPAASGGGGLLDLLDGDGGGSAAATAAPAISTSNGTNNNLPDMFSQMNINQSNKTAVAEADASPNLLDGMFSGGESPAVQQQQQQPHHHQAPAPMMQNNMQQMPNHQQQFDRFAALNPGAAMQTNDSLMAMGMGMQPIGMQQSNANVGMGMNMGGFGMGVNMNQPSQPQQPVQPRNMSTTSTSQVQAQQSTPPGSNFQSNSLFSGLDMSTPSKVQNQNQNINTMPAGAPAKSGSGFSFVKKSSPGTVASQPTAILTTTTIDTEPAGKKAGNALEQSMLNFKL